jgi:uncharacterized membrane protein YgdD (TMEM256/DUF423 family)
MPMNKRTILVTASVFGMLGVITGAFGAHALQARLTPHQLEIWHTGVQYQFYHAFALLFLSTLNRPQSNLVRTSYYFFTVGIIFFSGSLYILACADLLGNWTHASGPITPLGGLMFICGWLTMAIAAYRNK